MRSIIFASALAFGLALAGCKKEPNAPSGDGTKSAQEPSTTSSNTPAGSGSGGITPMAGVGAGPMTPVAGSESLQGGGSAAGSVLKEKAKGVAAGSPSSVSQMPTDTE